MHHIHKSAIVAYSAQQIYCLVNQIDAYPEFLNWCSEARILNQNNHQITALVRVNKSGFNQAFTTINTLTPNERIELQLKEGPFQSLKGVWIFTKLSKDACKVTLELDFSFSSKLMDIAISPIFTSIVNTQLDSFILRAKQIYG